MKNAFIALALVLVASTAFAALSSETKNRLQKINSSTFGRTILETIQVELQSKDDPRPRIITLLQELEQELIADQEEADAAHDHDANDNESTIKGIQDELESLSESLEANENVQSDLQAQLDTNRHNLDTQNNLLDTYESNLEALQASREANQATWEVQDTKYSKVLEVLSQVRGVITERLASRYNAEFIQTSHKQLLSNLAQVKENINAKSFKKTTPGFAKLANFLAVKVENALKDDEDENAEAALTTVVTLIDSLVSGIEAERTSATAFNEADQESFESESARLANAISDATANIDNLDNTITDLEERLKDVNSKIAYASERTSVLNDQLLSQQATYANKEESYRTTTHDRTEQLQLIQEVLEIVQNQLTGLRQYAEDYLGSH